MDAEKRRVLIQIGYEIPPSCGMCKHADITPGSDFGTCGLHTYEHEKHTGPARQLSINRHGRCPQFEPEGLKYMALHGFREFVGE